MMTKIINKWSTSEEYTDTQMASRLLGYASYIHTHTYNYRSVDMVIDIFINRLSELFIHVFINELFNLK